MFNLKSLEMEGIIILKGVVSDVTGYRDGCVIVKIGYTEMKYKNIEVKTFEVGRLSKPEYVDIPYRGARRLDNPEIFGFKKEEQPSLDGFGIPVSKLHRDDEVTAYIHWNDVPKFGNRVDHEICEVVIIADTPAPESLQNMVNRVSDRLTA